MWPEDNVNFNLNIRRVNNGWVVSWYNNALNRNMEYVFTTAQEASAFVAHQLQEEANRNNDEA